MAYPTDILIHCDNEMRDHFEFMIRRYMAELQEMNIRCSGKRPEVIRELILTNKCLTEVKNAGT